MRKILIWAGIPIAVVLLAVAALFLLVDPNQFRPTIQAQLEKGLGRTVKLGNMGLKLIPLAVRADDVEIGEAPEFGGTLPFARVHQLQVRVGLLGLLRKNVDVESLRVTQPEIELVKDRSGKWNYESLGKGQDASASREGGTSNTAVTISDLAIEDGRIAITDHQAGTPRAVYDHVDLKLSDFVPGRRFQAALGIHLPGKGTQRIALTVSGGPVSEAGFATTPDFTGELNIDGVTLSALRAFVGSAARQEPDLLINGKHTLAGHGGVLEARGTLSLKAPEVDAPLEIAWEAREDRSTEVATIPSLNIKLGGLALSGHAEAHLKNTPATLTAELKMNNAPVADLLKLAAAFGDAEGITGSGNISLVVQVSGTTAAPVWTASGSLRNAVLQVPSLRKPVEIQSADLKATRDSATLDNLSAGLGGTKLKGSASVRDFAHPVIAFTADAEKVDLAELADITKTQPAKNAPASASKPLNLNGGGTLSAHSVVYNQIALTDVKATCKLDHGVIRLEPVSAKLFGGEQNGAITVDTRGDKPAIAFQSKLANVDANQMLSAVTSVKQVLYGIVAADADVHLVAPAGGGDPARGLNGTMKLNLANGKITGVNLLNEAAALGKLLGFAKQQNAFTNILKLAGSVDIKDGVASTNDLAMEFDGGSLSATGTAGLADQVLNLKLTTVLGKDQMQRFGVGQIGGLMSTVLSNSKGELVVPALVTGSFAKPVFAPDTARIAKMKLDSLLPTRDNLLGPGGGGVRGLLDQLKGRKPGAAAAAGEGGASGAQQQQQAAPAGDVKSQGKQALKDLLKSIGEGKKQ